MVERLLPKQQVRGFETRLPLSSMEWIAAFVIVLIVVTLVVLRRSAWSANFTFSSRRASDLTLRTRMAEDEVREAIDRHDGEDLAP